MKLPKILTASSTNIISGLLDDAALAQVRFRSGGEDRSGKVGPILRFIKKFCRKFLHFLLITLLVNEKQDRTIHFNDKTQIFFRQKFAKIAKNIGQNIGSWSFTRAGKCFD
jgi:hypothetical protein